MQALFVLTAASLASVLKVITDAAFSIFYLLYYKTVKQHTEIKKSLSSVPYLYLQYKTVCHR